MGSFTEDGLGDAATVRVPIVELDPGTMVGEYRIEAKLGEGGMGCVYAATHPVIGKQAAIKVLHPQLSHDATVVERFVLEARAANQINHPNIVDVFAFGALSDGRNYFAMELLRGESLAARIRRAPLTSEEIVTIVEAVAIALEAAHDRGIVHRDLKPDNVFLVDTGAEQPHVKLLDFGIAKLVREKSIKRTATGNMLGTPAYLSPEQARGEQVDHRTDIYALGAMMFEMFTGRHVFEATSTAEMVAHHLFTEPSAPSTVQPAVPPRLDVLILRMLAKAPDGRPSLASLRAELRTWRSPEMSQAAPAVPVDGTSRRRSRLPWVIAGALAAAGAVAIAFNWPHDSDDEHPPVAALVPAPADAAVEHASPPPPSSPVPSVTLTIDSVPRGAMVYRASDGQQLGPTPLEQRLDRGDGTFEVVLKLRGFADKRVALSTARDGSELLRLVRARGPVHDVARTHPSSQSGSGSGSATSTDLHGSKFLDPYGSDSK